MPLIPTSRIALYAERGGAGARLVWISGTGQDLRNPPSLLETPLGRAFDTLVYDQRGLGRSDKPDGAFTMADYADDCAALLDAIGWERAHIAGYSFGGMVAQHFAIRHPSRVNRLVLAATSPGGAGGSSFPLHELQKLDVEARLRKQLLLDARMTEARLDSPGPALKAQMEMMRAAEAQRAGNDDGVAGLQRQLQARAGHDAWEGLAKITAPTLACAGAYDLLASPQNARNMAGRVPGSVLRFYKGGHGFLVECPDFLDDVAAFLNGGTVAPRSEQEAAA